MEERVAGSGPIPLPPGTEVRAASSRGLTLRCAENVAPRSVIEFDLLLGARPLQVMARVVKSQAEGPTSHVLQTEFVALAQMERDVLVDFLQAVGIEALRVRRRAEP